MRRFLKQSIYAIKLVWSKYDKDEILIVRNSDVQLYFSCGECEFLLLGMILYLTAGIKRNPTKHLNDTGLFYIGSNQIKTK